MINQHQDRPIKCLASQLLIATCITDIVKSLMYTICDLVKLDVMLLQHENPFQL